MSRELREHCQRRKAALLESRQPWMRDWQQVSEYVDPTRGRFGEGDNRNQAARRSRSKVINNRATQVLRVMAAGMMSHMTSKGRPWFRLGCPDAEMGELYEVRVWLDEVTKRVRETLAKSNFYKAMPVVYTEDGLYGVAPLLVLEDAAEVVRFYPLTVGSYAIGLDDEQRVDTLWRCYQKTARQLAQRYGEGKLPDVVRRALVGNGDECFTVQSLVERNPDERAGEGDLGLQAPQYRAYREVVWVDGSQGDGHGVLDVGGHYEAPFVVARWNPVAEDIYSSSPALDSLGDIKQLQYLEGEKLRLLDLISKPPLGIPESLRNQPGGINPGAKIYLPQMQVGARVEPIYTPNYGAFQAVSEEVRVVEGRIGEAFFYNLFLMLQSLDDRSRTATEIAERREEKAAVLGPTLESLTDEVLDPVVVRVFRLLERAGQIPLAPEVLADVGLKIEYTSILAQAQKADGISAIERVVQFVGGVAQLAGANVVDKLDVDQTVDEYHQSLGAPARLLRSDEAIAELREGRAQEQQQQMQMAQMQQMASAAKQGGEAMQAMGVDGDMLGQALSGAAGGGM